MWLFSAYALIKTVQTYFPKAKHSSFTDDPLATETMSENWTSILGSYSPITAVKMKQDY